MATKTKVKPKKSPTKKVSKKSHGADDEDDIYTRTKRQIDSNRGGAEFYKIAAERTVIRIFPFKDEQGEEQMFLPQKQHWLKRPEEVRIPCPGRGCALCALRDDLDEDSWAKVKASTQYLVNAVVREGGENRQVIVRLPKTVVEGRDPNPGMIDLMEPRLKVCDYERGYDFIIRRSAKGRGPINYVVKLDENGPKPIGMEVKPVDLTRFQLTDIKDVELDAAAEKVKKAYLR
jgi:hypothetical protein